MTEKEIDKFGEAFTRGATRQLGKIVTAAFVLVIVFMMIANYFSWGTDDSDTDGWNRSGMRIHTDHKTGVQYLSDGSGGMCVRVDRDGKPIISQ